MISGFTRAPAARILVRFNKSRVEFSVLYRDLLNSEVSPYHSSESYSFAIYLPYNLSASEQVASIMSSHPSWACSAIYKAGFCLRVFKGDIFSPLSIGIPSKND